MRTRLMTVILFSGASIVLFQNCGRPFSSMPVDSSSNSNDASGSPSVPSPGPGPSPVPTPTPGAPLTDSLIPSSRVTLWKPGVTYNGGIPVRTTIYKTLSPLGSGKDDTAQIQTALDNCPPNQVVLLTKGVFNINGNGINFRTPNCTLRGSGPGSNLNTGKNGVAASNTAGSFVADPSATQLVKADRKTNLNFAVLYVGGGMQFSSSINLAADAEQGSYSLTLASNPGIQVGEFIFVDMNTSNHPDVVWGPSFGPPGDGSRRWFVRQDRSLNQIVEVTGVQGNVITFATPLHASFKVAYQAQVSRFTNPLLHGLGVEDIFVFGGMGGDGHGNIAVSACAYCWVKHVEAMWSVGTGVGFYGTYRSELRDSYIHETPDANPGGAGYLTGMNFGASDNLFENNIMWYGNKVDVMRGTGGGNVIAYNYTDDSFGSTFPHSPEAGINAGHYTTPHMELLEGNYSPNFTGDSYWGNSIYITVFRNWLSGLRAAHAPLNSYVFTQGGCNYPYMDITNRNAVHMQAYSYYHNFVGNVLGKPGQVLLNYPQALQTSCYNGTEDKFIAENFNDDPDPNPVTMWRIGAYQATVNSTGNWSWVSNTISTQLRQGNFDFVTGRQNWYNSPIGAVGVGSGTALPIPNSLYLDAKPAFFGSNPWPWVDPSTGQTYVLPAKARFDAGTPNVVGP